MEEKLEGGSYKSISQFKRDFRLIVDNCRQYNGSDNGLYNFHLIIFKFVRSTLFAYTRL